jgi:hypothetical protein
MRTAALVALALALPYPADLAAQDRRGPLAGLQDGAAHLSFPVRGRTCWSSGDRITDDDCPCGSGIAHATVVLAGGAVTSFRMKVRRAGDPAPESSGVALGQLSGQGAAGLLLALAARGGAGGEELIAAASIADSATVWPDLLALARNPTLAASTRRAAVFWLSQAAGDAATRGLDSIAADTGTDRELREHAVFALSQRPRDEAVPALIRIARGNGDRAVRRKAVFWLGQTDDPRAVALFEEILRR